MNKNHKRVISVDKRCVLHLPCGHQFDNLTAGQFITPTGRIAIYALSRYVQLSWKSRGLGRLHGLGILRIRVLTQSR